MDDDPVIAELRQDYDDIANAQTERMLYLDDFPSLMDVEFDFTEDHNTAPWPKAFEHHLKAIPSISLCVHNRRSTRSEVMEKGPVARLERRDAKSTHGTQYKSMHHRRPAPTQSPLASDQDLFIGSPNLRKHMPHISNETTSPQKGRDFLPFSGFTSEEGRDPWHKGISGILHNLPDQFGIPAFQRVSFMAYGLDSPITREEAASLANEDRYKQLNESFECYEGVVLPGGNIILGRWWTPFDNEDQYNVGPFILWAVED